MNDLKQAWSSARDVDSIYGGEDQGPTSKFTLVPFNKIAITTAGGYLVKGLIPRKGLALVWGPPKCGKSFWAFDVGMHVALDKPYRGRKVKQGPVIYIACEGQAGMGARCEAWRDRFLSDSPAAIPFYVLPNRIGLPSDLDELLVAIRAVEGKPALVVIDTLNRSIEGSESMDADMGAYIKAADTIKESFGCAVLVVHHCGIEGTRPRGHTSLTGAADAQISVKRSTVGLVSVTVEFMKDGPEGEEIHSTLEAVEVGIDEDGDPISSCVLVPADAPLKTAPTRKLGKNEQTMLDILAEAMPAGLTQEEWNERGRKDGIGTRRRADLSDCRRRLQTKKLVHTYDHKWFTAGQ